MPNHDGAAPRQVGAGTATASTAVVSEVEVVQETLATADGVGPLLRGREREEEGYSDGGWGGVFLQALTGLNLLAIQQSFTGKHQA